MNSLQSCGRVLNIIHLLSKSILQFNWLILNATQARNPESAMHHDGSQIIPEGDSHGKELLPFPAIVGFGAWAYLTDFRACNRVQWFVVN